MNIALIYPKWTNKGIASYFSRRIGLWYPLGLLSLAAVAEKVGHNVMVIDAEAENMVKVEVRKKLSEFKPDLIGFTGTTPNYHITTEWAISTRIDFPKVPIVIGGNHLSIVGEEAFKSCFDYGFIGESEETWEELLKTGNPVKGMYYWDKGQFKSTGKRELIKDLDVLPQPARHLIDMKRYHLGTRKGILPSATIMFSRGCPYECLPSSEKILMDDGITTKPIVDIRVGDMVSSINRYGQLVSSCVVASKRIPARNDIVKITTNDGGILRCTIDHRVLKKDGWVEAGLLKVGDLIACRNIYNNEGWDTKSRISKKADEEWNQTSWFSNRVGVGISEGKIITQQSNEQSSYCGEKQTVAISQCRCNGESKAENVIKQSYENKSQQRQGKYQYESIQRCCNPTDKEITFRRENTSFSNVRRTETKTQRENEEKQSYENKGIKRQGDSSIEAENIVQSETLFREMVQKESGGKSDRSRVGTIPSPIRVSVCRGWEVLDRYLSERKMQKSRLYLEEWQKQGGTTLQFNFLAQPPISKRPRNDEGLRGGRLACIRNYGGNAEKFAEHYQSSKPVVAFIQIVSIAIEKPADVYDIETFPYHNFIASGFIVHNCIFCHVGFGRIVRRHSVGYMLDEIRSVHYAYGISHFYFVDDNLTLDRKYILDLCEGIRGLKITFEGSTRANLVDDEVISVMVKAGLIRLSFGLESADKRIREIAKKNVPLESYAKAADICNKYGVEVVNSVILGLPGETRNTIDGTINYLKKAHNVHEIAYNIAVPYPGTELLEMAQRKEHGLELVDSNYSKFRRNIGVLKVGDLTPKDLSDLQNKGYASVYLSRWRIIPMLKRSGLIGFILTYWRGVKYWYSILQKKLSLNHVNP